MNPGERIADQADGVQEHSDGEHHEEKPERRIGPEACGIFAAVDGPAAPGVDDPGLEVLPQIIRRPHAEQFEEDGAEEGVGHGVAMSANFERHVEFCILQYRQLIRHFLLRLDALWFQLASFVLLHRFSTKFYLRLFLPSFLRKLIASEMHRQLPST